MSVYRTNGPLVLSFQLSGIACDGYRRGYVSFAHFLLYCCMSNIYVLRRVGMGTISELSLRKVGILTLPGKVRIPT